MTGMQRASCKFSGWMAAVSAALLVSLGLAAAPARADEVQVAVAANFVMPMRQIAAAFEQASGHHVALTPGSTGKLYAQIKHGAPFEVLLAADEATPDRLVAEGLAVEASRFTYATGRLVLWSAQAGLVDEGGAVLRRADLRHLALANPQLAPYGAAAIATLRRLGLLDAWQTRIVQGENIAQTHQFVASGNAELGFVALSQVVANGRIASGSGWVVPQADYPPIRQDAVLLKPGQGRPAAQALLQYLHSDAARAVILSYGYSL